jgi:hypothetical protein
MDFSELGTLTILAIAAFIWVLPIIIILSSSKTGCGEKIAWLLAVLFISWFAIIFYLLLAPIKNKG